MNYIIKPLLSTFFTMILLWLKISICYRYQHDGINKTLVIRDFLVILKHPLIVKKFWRNVFSLLVTRVHEGYARMTVYVFFPKKYPFRKGLIYNHEKKMYNELHRRINLETTQLRNTVITTGTICRLHENQQWLCFM